VAIPIALTEIASAGEASLAMTGGNVSFGAERSAEPSSLFEQLFYQGRR